MSEHKIEGALHIVAGPRKPPDLSGHTDDVEHHFGDARSGPPRSWQWRGLPPPLPRAPIRVDDYVDEANAQQGIYLSAIGGLVQFNAIVATVQGSVITLSDVVQLGRWPPWRSSCTQHLCYVGQRGQLSRSGRRVGSTSPINTDRSMIPSSTIGGAGEQPCWLWLGQD